MTHKKQKFLFVYLKTGGGHYAPAKALADYLLKYRNNEVEIKLLDGLEKSIWYAKLIIEGGYRFLQNRAKWIYELIYAFHKLSFFSRLSVFLVLINTRKYLEKIILEERPDKIIIFHFFLIETVYKIVEKHKLNIRLITVVTDPFIAPPLWFLRKRQNFIVFSQLLKKHCVKKGVDEKNIRVYDFMLDENYSHIASHEEIVNFKVKHGINKEKVLLIMGGGDGIPKGIQILKRLLSTNRNYQIAVVCGNNKTMYTEALGLKHAGKYDNLNVYGYVDFIYELISISDVIITKCGASTFMQILLSKKVPVVNSYLWEQEKGNVDFLVDNHLGIFERRISKLPGIINELFSNEEHIVSYQNNIDRINLKNGTADVAEFIIM